MALSLQNLFCSGSEDFDDEEFLSALEGTEPSFSTNTHTTPVRLRPISAKDTQVIRSSSSFAQPLFSGETVPMRLNANPTEKPSVPLLDQDLDDDELLSVCSEMEAGVSQEQYQTPNPRLCLRPISQTSQNSSYTSNSSPSFQLRPSRVGLSSDPEPRMFTRQLQDTGPIKHHSYGFTANSPTDSNFPASGRGRGQCQSLSPTAKRPCLRPSLETQAVTPTRTGPPLPQSTYPRCTTQTAVTGQAHSWQGGAGSSALPKTPQMPSRSHQSCTMQTPVVTTHLVQLMEAANKTPRVLAWETPPPKERRFPGPAGLLPQQGSGRRLDEILISTPHTPSHGAQARHRSKENVPSQQSMAEEFVRGPWATMKAELSLDENDPDCFLRTYSVVMVIRKAALKQLPKNKVPRMAVALKSLTPANGDASAVFRDATGEIQGTVHHLLLEERESELKAGSVLLLQQVGVFSPSHRNHYLNVTPSNLVKIYSPAEGNDSSRVSTELMTEREVDVNSNDTQSDQCSSFSTAQCRPEQGPFPSSSTVQPDINLPAASHFLTSTALSRTHQPFPSITGSKAPQPAVFSASYSSMQPRAPGPAALHQSSHTVQTKASSFSFITAQPRRSPATNNADWDMDDLDSLLCDLPEDTGE
ncbi:homologous recombination OB-fold protein [Aquarana catesbeiana]|uniref:homologous recombination OB-fold protein n=1 Tax=Aquarana catesbeiana TaxID=8400 RepID=UPI003CC97A5F